MTSKQVFSEQRIIESLNADYGLHVTRLELLPWGADLDASVYKGQVADEVLFVKAKRGRQSDISVTFLSLFHTAGIQQIILPIKTMGGQLIQYIEDFTLIVYPFIENQNGFNQALTDDQWLTLGQALRKVHEIKIPHEIQVQLRRETYSPKWRDVVRSLYVQFEAEPSGDEIARKLLMFIKGHTREIHRLVERAEFLGQKIQKEPTEFVLCHSDIHGGNVLIDVKGSLYIVDWDEPIMAPKERDLMFIGGGVANVWNNPHEQEIFYQGYGKTEINNSILAYYRHERIVEDIAIYAQELLLTTVGGDKRLEMYKHFIAMFEPRGVVDIAFKTDENL